MLALAVVVQAGYLAVQILLFRHDLRQFSPKATAYGSIYFTLLAAHHAHVVLGLLLELAVLWQVVRKGLTSYWLIGVRGSGSVLVRRQRPGGVRVFTQLSPSL